MLDGIDTSIGIAANLKFTSLGYVESVSWKGKPFSSPMAATAKGWSYSVTIEPSIKSIVDSPIVGTADVTKGTMLSTVDLGWFGKLLYWGRK